MVLIIFLKVVPPTLGFALRLMSSVNSFDSEQMELWRRNPNWAKATPQPHVARTPQSRQERQAPRKGEEDVMPLRPFTSFSENQFGAAGVL